MDGLQWFQTLLKMDDLGGFPIIFGSTPISRWPWISPQFVQAIVNPLVDHFLHPDKNVIKVGGDSRVDVVA